MASVSIMTLEPIGLGGVPTMASAIYQLQMESGHYPRLVYVDAESVPTTGLRSLLRYYWQHLLPHYQVRRGMRGLSIPLYPLPQWAGWYAPAIMAYRDLRTDIRVAVTGSAHVGLPYTVSRKPFIVWVATRYIDELQGRARVGDDWAEGLLSSSQWTRLQVQEARVLRQAARVISLSPYTTQRILDDLPELEERIDTILCPVDMDQFHPAYGNVVNPIGSRFLLLTARILDPRKNVSMLLDAFARVRAAMPDINLAIIGDPPREIDVSKCEQLGLTQAVQFLPARSQTSLIPYYQSAELFVLPSTQEGLSISMLEAMACGLPVISTRCGGPEGVIQDGLTGRLTTNDDADSYADAILSVLSDPILLKEMRLAANSYAQRTYAQPIVMSRLHNVFARIYPQHFTNLG